METLSIVGGVKFALISSDNFACPSYGVTYAYPRWPRSRPQFQVLWAIVVSYSVAMVYGLFWKTVSSQEMLHHQNVFEDVVSLTCPRVSWCPGQHISGLMSCAVAGMLGSAGVGLMADRSVRIVCKFWCS